MTYCWKCRYCAYRTTSSSRDIPPLCDRLDGHGLLMRDYRSEAVGIGSGVRVSRDGTVMDQARLILPTEDDYKGPGDPDGTKGMREWHEKFAPRADNPAPVHPGRIDKRVF